MGRIGKFLQGRTDMWGESTTSLACEFSIQGCYCMGWRFLSVRVNFTTRALFNRDGVCILFEPVFSLGRTRHRWLYEGPAEVAYMADLV